MADLESDRPWVRDALQCRNGRVPGTCGQGERPTHTENTPRGPMGMGGRTMYARYDSPNGAGGTGLAPTPGTKTTTPAAKTYKLPDPETQWSANLAKVPHASKLPLWAKKDPNYDEILQQQIANCYLAATLAAMANTSIGRARIKAMIDPHTGPIVTTCRKYDMDSKYPEQQIASDRWFTVKFKSGSVDVSDVLYHDDSDRDWNLRYLTTPKGDRALWGAIIEVAYASFKGSSYDNISATKGNTLDKFFNEFSDLKWEIVPPDSNRRISKAAGKAKIHPMIIATKLHGALKLTSWHGYAVLGMHGQTVSVYDPMYATLKRIALTDLLGDIQAAAISGE